MRHCWAGSRCATHGGARREEGAMVHGEEGARGKEKKTNGFV
jgi:hypothetical protein